MLGLLSVLPGLKHGRCAGHVAMTTEGPGVEQAPGKTVRLAGGGLKCLLGAPWGRLILGEDPVPVLLLLVFALLLLPPLMGLGLGLLALAAVGVLRACLWCRGAKRDEWT